MAKKGSDLLVETLIDWGVKTVYGLPGDSIDTTVEALRRHEDQIQFVQVRHEEVGALAAASEAKLTGRLGVCFSIGGPGAIHLLNGLYDAKMDHAPVLALLGQVTTDNLNEDYFQEVNTPTLFDDVAVFNRTISTVDNLAEVVDQAIRSAYEYKGVAVLTIPDDIPDEAVKTAYQSAAQHIVATHTQVADQTLQAMKHLLTEASKPLVLVGVGAKEAAPVVREFIEANHLPFISTLPAKGLIGDNHPQSLGNVGKLGTKPAYEAMKATDLMIMLGTNYPYKPYLPEPGQAKCIQIDVNAENLGKRYAVDLAIKGDVGDVITAFNRFGSVHSETNFLKACQENMANWNDWMAEKRALSTSPLAPEAMVDYLGQTAPQDAIFSIDVGTSTSWAARFLQVKPTQKFIISAWLGTMGCGLPGAIAAQVAYPKRRAITLNGDGAFAMVMEDFVTAVKYHLPLICIVINNQKLAFIEYEQQSAGQLNFGIDLADINFAKFAEACGGVGITARSNDEFKTALDQAFRVQDKPVLINAYVADNAPLPGKIVTDEAKGYVEYGAQYLKDEKKLPKLPPLKDILRQFF